MVIDLVRSSQQYSNTVAAVKERMAQRLLAGLIARPSFFSTKHSSLWTPDALGVDQSVGTITSKNHDASNVHVSMISKRETHYFILLN